MSYQLALMARIIKTGQLKTALSWGISDEDFTVPEAQELWRLVFSYYTQPHTAGSVITKTTLEHWIKNYTLAEDMGAYTLDALCHEVRRERIVVKSNELLANIAEELKIHAADPIPSLATHMAGLSQLIALGSTKNADLSLVNGFREVQRQMKLMKQGVDFSIMSWPWEPMNQATMGIQPDDFIVFYGRPKSMKSWVLCAIIAWAFEQEKKIVVYTKEMTPKNVYARVLATILGLEYDELRMATTSDADDARIDELIEIIASDPHLQDLFIVLSGQDVSDGGDTIPWLQSKVDKYKPALVFIDGLYLMSSHVKTTTDEARVRTISRATRNMVLSTGIPVVATMQANRKAAAHKEANLDEIAFSDAISQDTTISARVINDKTTPTISIILAGSREFKLHGFRINGRPAKDFSFHSLLNERDIMQAKEGDVDTEAAAGKKSAGPKKKARDPNEVKEDNLMAQQLKALHNP